MMKFQGSYFDGKTSKAHPVSIFFDGTHLVIEGEDGVPKAEFPLARCVIAPPLGSSRRVLTLPDGSRCESDDSEAVSALEAHMRGNRGMRLVHFLESRRSWVAGCFLTLLLCVWLFIAYGIPFLARGAAASVPRIAMEKISEEAVKMLDEEFFAPSELDSARADELRAMFQRVSQETGGDSDYHLDFRKSPMIGPNAFALPSGLIVMTDEMVEIAKNDEELEGIFVHEMAHVRARHGLRQLIQNAGVFLLISALVGDITSITSLAATLPTLLVESGYSRKFEREADRAAGLHFMEKGRSSKPYQDILLRITEDEMDFPGSSLLSTHPETRKRVEYLKSLEASGGSM